MIHAPHCSNSAFLLAPRSVRLLLPIIILCITNYFPVYNQYHTVETWSSFHYYIAISIWVSLSSWLTNIYNRPRNNTLLIPASLSPTAIIINHLLWVAPFIWWTISEKMKLCCNIGVNLCNPHFTALANFK